MLIEPPMIELMEFAGVAVWLLSLSLIGLPVLLAARPAEPAALVLAPVYGFALMGVLSTVLYTAGLNGRQQYFLFVALGAAASLGLLLWRRRTGFRFGGGGLIAAALAAWAAVIGLLLAGKAIGGYRYFVFQGNHWDHLNYLTNAALYAREDYKTVVDAVLGRTLGILTPALDANPIATIAPLCHENRPGVTLVLSALSAAPGWPQGTGIEATAFVYLCFLASLPVFPLTLCAGRLFRAPAPLAGAVAALFCGGFFAQYVLDIDAWSQLTSFAPLVTLLTVLASARSWTPGLAAGGPLPGPGALVLLLLPPAASLLHLYPEGAVMAAPSLLLAAVWLAAKGKLPRRLFLASVAAAVLAGLSTLPAYASTIAFLVRQAGVSLDEGAAYNSFAPYFFQFILGKSTVAELAAHRGEAGFLPTVAANAVLGWAGLHPISATIDAGPAERLAAGAAALGVLVLAAAAIARARHDGIAGALVAAVAGSTGFALCFLAGDRLYQAGKTWIAGAPFIFLLMMLPLLPVRDCTAPARRRRVLTLVPVLLAVGYGGAQFAIAVVRPVLVQRHGNGIAWLDTYPSAQIWERDLFTGGIETLDPALSDCRSVLIDLENPFQRHLAAVNLYRRGIPYLMRQPINGYYDTNRPFGPQTQCRPLDCRIGGPGGKGRPLTLERFDNGYVPGTALSFDRPESATVDGRRFLRFGWGRPGPAGAPMAWTEGNLLFWLAQPLSGDLVLEADISVPEVPGRPPLTLDVLANGTVIDVWRVHSGPGGPVRRTVLSADRLRLPREGGSALSLSLRVSGAPVAWGVVPPTDPPYAVLGRTVLRVASTP